MELFRQDGFGEGRWAKNLCSELAPLSIIPRWRPRVRLWRGTWQQWIQFEPEGSDVPFFWSGKPAVLSSPVGLYAGYYVERGLQQQCNQPEMIMDSEWHWHSFYRALCEETMPNFFTAVVARLPEARRCAWVSNPPSGNRRQAYPLESHATATKVKAHIDSIPPSEWVDVVIGVQFSLDECLGFQDRIVEKIIEPLRLGFELYKRVRP